MCTDSTRPTNHPLLTEHRQALFRLLVELLLTLLVALILRHYATAVIEATTLSGLGERYGYPSFGEAERWRSPSPDERAAYAVWLRWAAPRWLPAWAMLGGLALWLARGHTPALRPLLGASVGALIGLFSGPLPLIGPTSAPALALSAGVGTIAGALIWAVRPRRRGGPLAPATVAQALLWPAFALLAGMSWLALADFAAGADPKAQYLAIRGAQGLLLATLSGLLTTVCRTPIARQTLRLAQWLSGALGDRRRWPVFIGGLLLVIALGLLGRLRAATWFGLVIGFGQPHLSGELLRALALLSIAWVGYRSGEWSDGIRWRFLTVAHGLVLLGLWLSKDGGPALVIGLLALLWLASWPLKKRLAVDRPVRRRMAAALALLLVVGTVALWRSALHDFLPNFSPLAAARDGDRQHPETGRRDDMLRIQWLMAAAPAGGFGPGRVPWCGAAAQLGEKACLKDAALRDGAPLQTPEDFAVALWVSYYGAPLTWIGLGVLAGWLLALVLAASPAHWPRPGRFTADDMNAHLLFWLVAVAALGLLAQTLIALGGSLRWSLLSGLPLPLMAYGKTSLIVAAAWMGLAQRSTA